MKHVDKLQTTKEEIKVLENLIKDLYIKQRELMKAHGQQSWWDFFLELLGY
tara:strand:+ start:968 stop:1120 length:153 start_codon:yes stop_codon:yes gene_type:complete